VLESADPDQLLPGLLPFICQSDTFFEHAVGTSAGSLSPRTNWKSLADYAFALPRLEEQRRIEKLLQSLRHNIESIHAAALELKKLEELQFQYLLLGEGCHSSNLKQTPFGLTPASWPLKAICDIGDVAYGISAAVSDNTDPAIGWPILTGANLALSGEINLGKLVYHPKPSKSSFILKRDDILVNWRSGSPEHVGKTAIFDLEGEWTFASFILRLRPSAGSNPRYLWRLLNLMRAKGLFHRGTSQQVNFKMNAAHFREIQVISPPKHDQDRIVDAMKITWAAQRELMRRSHTAINTLSTILNLLMSPDCVY
jgi:type I restriction enzyme S subunit